MIAGTGSSCSRSFLGAMIGGLIVGGIRIALGGSARTPQSEGPGIARIDSSKIPIGGGIGSGLVILVLFTGLLHDLPAVRFLAVSGIVAGLIFAVALRLWRRSHAPEPPLSLGLKRGASKRR